MDRIKRLAEPVHILAERSMRWLPALGVCIGLAACGGGADSAGNAVASAAGASVAVAPLRVVATPNPNVFPLLLALAQDPNLPVSLVPVASGGDIVNTFNSGHGDALLSMTYTAAQDVVTGQIPQLQLVDVDFWSGFWMLAPKSAGITQFSQLAGKGVLVSGPTSGGKGGGPDLIFQAAARRAGLSASSFDLCYLPVMQAVPMILQQQAMNSNTACASGEAMAPTAISLVDPAATGLVMQSTTSTSISGPMVKAISFQTLFTGYTAWPQTQLPHGGVSILSTVLNDSSRQQEVQAVLAAYRAAADAIMAAKGHPAAMSQITNSISSGITTYYGQYGLSLPAPVIAAALTSGDLVYRTDLSLSSVQADLSAFLAEVVGATPPASFFHPI